MSRATLAPLLLLLAAPPAQAAKGSRGTKELRLESTGPAVPTFGVVSGVHLRRNAERDSNATHFGVGAGFGYFLKRELSLGFELGTGRFEFLGGTFTTFKLAPYFKYLYVPYNVGFFFEISPGYFMLDDGDATHLFTTAFSVGFEFFVTHTWAIRVAPEYQIFKGDDLTIHLVGLSWGLSTYF